MMKWIKRILRREPTAQELNDRYSERRRQYAEGWRREDAEVWKPYYATQTSPKTEPPA